MGDFIHGGGIDVAFLGFGEIDRHGNVNVSRLNNISVGPGAFIDIAQFCRKLVLCGTFETGGFKCSVGHGSLTINSVGKICKFVKEVAQITYSGIWSAQTKQEVVIVTERAVFKLLDGQMVLTEAAPGIDVEADIVSRMEFKPKLTAPVAPMDRRYFT